MQILLPLEEFPASARVLNDRALKLQCFHAKQLLMMLEGTIALFEAPCYKQWEGFNGALALYGFTMSTEARRRNLKTDRAFFSKRLPKGDFLLPNFDAASDELGHE